MGILLRLAAASRRFDRAFYRRLGIDRLAAVVLPRIPQRLRGISPTYVLAVFVVIAAVLSTTALWRSGPSGPSGRQLKTPGASSPGATFGPAENAVALDDQTASIGAGVTGRSRPGGTQREGTGTAVSTKGLVATGRGVTASTITIGVIIGTGVAEMRQRVVGGECGNDCGDDRIPAQAAIDYINSQGGVAKRKIVPVFHEIDINENFDVSAQESCTDFTEDHQVFAVVDRDGSGPWAEQLIACLAKRATPRIASMETDQQFADEYAPYYYDPNMFNLTRAGPIHVLGLLKQGYFEPGAKIGLLLYDRPADRRAADQGIKRTLSAQGLTLTDEVAVSYPSSISDLSRTAAQSSSASLRFSSNGVTHLLIQDRRSLTFVFAANAESQAYRPRYGITSFSQPRELQRQLTPDSLRRMQGVGWNPVTDVDNQRIPPPNATRKLCIDIMTKAGVSSPQFDHKALTYCDSFFFLKTVADSAKVLTTADFQTAAEGLGTKVEPVLTHATRFGPGRHDGASAWRPVAFDNACTCFYYTGDLEPVG